MTHCEKFSKDTPKTEAKKKAKNNFKKLYPLAKILDIGTYYENEDFLYIAVDAYAKKNNVESFEDLYEIYLDDFDNYKDKIKYEDSDYPHIKITWNEEKPDTMKSLCPKLFEGFYLESE